MRLLEREGELDRLARLLHDVADGHGRVAVISGEAGIGKSSLVDTFAGSVADGARVLTGVCDDLLAPQPFGPFRDMATGPRSPLRRALEAGAHPEAMMAAIRAEADNPLQPTVMVIEDLHWADDASLDAVRLLGRRIDALRCLLIVTFRDDELSPDHPLRKVLGALTGPAVARLPLGRLSEAAVGELSDRTSPGGSRLHEVTGGNPFFVSQLLAFPDTEVPPTVRDAVLSRVRRLDPPVAAALESLSVLPGRTGWSVAQRVMETDAAVLEPAEHHGFVDGDATGVWFRHEILRRTIEDAVPASRRMRLHGLAVDALLPTDASRSRLLHHAVESGRGDVVVRFAPDLAHEAGRLGSHRQAVLLHRQVLRFAATLEPAVQARTHRRLAYELVLVNRSEEGAAEAAEAVARWERLGNPVELGIALITRSHACHWALEPECALASAERAVDVLEAQEPQGATAMAHAQLAWILLMRDDYAAAELHARTAVSSAEQVGSEEIRAHALSQLGGALLLQGDPAGEIHAREALELARRIGHHEHATLACMLLVSGLFSSGRLVEGEQYMDMGIAYAREQEIDIGAATLLMMRGGLDLARGDWQRAEAAFTEVLEGEPRPGWGETVTLALYGRLLARRGDPRAAGFIERAWAIAVRSRELRRIAPAGAALAEDAWLSGDAARCAEVADRVEEALALAQRAGHGWYSGETARYYTRAGGTAGDLDHVAQPWASALRGEWRSAAEAWERGGWRYEQALELADSGDEAAVLQGLAILDELGAVVPARRVRQRLRDMGVSRIPRGPSRSTRANPANLTARQLDVLALLAQGLTNAEIADRLVLSVRTVDHHVSAILDKLQVHSRQDAAEAAAELGVEMNAPI